MAVRRVDYVLAALVPLCNNHHYFRPPCFPRRQAAFSSKAGTTPAHSNSFNFRTTPRFLRHNRPISNPVAGVAGVIINTRPGEAAGVAAAGPPMIGNSQSSVATAIPVRHLTASLHSNSSSSRPTETSNSSHPSSLNTHRPPLHHLSSITASITTMVAGHSNKGQHIDPPLMPEA